MYSGSVDDVEPRLSKIILTPAALGAGLNLADSIRTRGVQRSVVVLALGAARVPTARPAGGGAGDENRYGGRFGG